MKRLFIFLVSFCLALGIGVTVVSGATLLDARNNLSAVTQRAGTTEGSLETIVGQLIAGALTLVGLIFLALMVYAGYLWMTAQGEEEPVNKAKQIISGSIIGLVILLSAYAITVFVTARFDTGPAAGDGPTGNCCRVCTATDSQADSGCVRTWNVTPDVCTESCRDNPGLTCTSESLPEGQCR